MELTKKMFREVLNKRHEQAVKQEQEKLHALPKDFVQREMDRHVGNGVYHARKRKQGDYLYFQDRQMFNVLFEEWKDNFVKSEHQDRTQTLNKQSIDNGGKEQSLGNTNKSGCEISELNKDPFVEL